MTGTLSVQPAERSVAHRVQVHSPAATSPLWETRSISRYPGVSSSRQEAHHHRDLPAEQASWLGLAHAPTHHHAAQLTQVALHSGDAGRGEQLTGLGRAIELAMALQDRDQIQQERLEPLRAEVVGGLLADFERRPEPRAVPLSPGDPLAQWQLSPTPEHLDGVLAPVPGRQAEGVQQPSPLHPPRPPVSAPQLLRQLVSPPDAHGPRPLAAAFRRPTLGVIPC